MTKGLLIEQLKEITSSKELINKMLNSIDYWINTKSNLVNIGSYSNIRNVFIDYDDDQQKNCLWVEYINEYGYVKQLNVMAL